jgi:hypothetical protein
MSEYSNSFTSYFFPQAKDGSTLFLHIKPIQNKKQKTIKKRFKLYVYLVRRHFSVYARTI